MTTHVGQNASTNHEVKAQSRATKRILSVTVKRMIDDSPDTSYLGEYASRPTSNYSIDRAHSLDCASQTYNVRVDDIRTIKHAIVYLKSINEGRDPYYAEHIDSCNDAIDILNKSLDAIGECNCGERGDMGRNEYRYFNPSFNYVKRDGTLTEGNTPEDVRKYVAQDYECMESLNRGDWTYIGIRAEAKYTLTGGVVQTVTSGGLWGIESDSGAYLSEVEEEELAELRKQLEAIGFSKRAVSAALRDIERTNE